MPAPFIVTFMEIEYLQAQIKPQINGEFVYKIVNKYYPGTILH